jgi:hypothetical protein
MSVTKGIITVAFGEEYERLAAHTMLFSRKYTNLPITVITNISEEKQDPLWLKNSNVNIIREYLSQDQNRFVKLHLYEYTPYDETLYIDCDSVIKNNGVDEIFNMLKTSDIMVNFFCAWKKNEKIPNIYKKAFVEAGVKLPVKIYNGGILLFKKNDAVIKMFKKWFDLWKALGSGREMPALNCALKIASNYYDLSLSTFPKSFFSPDVKCDTCVVQHNYNYDRCSKINWFEEFCLPKHTEFKPFDSCKDDWTFVEMI